MSEQNSELMRDQGDGGVHEYTVLEKFEGEVHPDNLIERLHIENGKIVRVEKFENGEQISSEDVTESGNFTGEPTE